MFYMKEGEVVQLYDKDVRQSDFGHLSFLDIRKALVSKTSSYEDLLIQKLHPIFIKMNECYFKCIVPLLFTMV